MFGAVQVLSPEKEIKKTGFCRSFLFGAGCFIGFEKKPSNINDFYSQQTAYYLIQRNIKADKEKRSVQ